MINLLICDDDDLIRESLKIIIEMDKEINVLGTCSNGKECLEFINNNDVDILLLDMRMPIMNGTEAMKEIYSLKINVKILVLTTFDEDELIYAAMKYGASGYLLKTSKPQKIISAIKSVASGNGLFEIEIISKLCKLKSSKETLKTHIDILTDRENDIAKLISEGLSNKEISEKLYLTEGTVKNYISNILLKLNLKHRTQIAIYILKILEV